MRRHIVVFATATLLTASATADAPQALTFFRYGPPEQWLLQQALDCSIARWRAATCLPIDISYAATHMVRFAPPEQMQGRVASTGGTWSAARIRILDTVSDPTLLCDVLAHEIRHVLARDNGHPGPAGSMSYPTVSVSQGARITQEDLESVCDRQECQCFAPEAVDN